VQLTGQIEQSQVLSYLQAADAYIQPSRLEGLSNATMEAAAVGLPVITTDTCGQREVIANGVNGWLVPTENPAALRQALEELVADLEHAQMLGRTARATIERDFNPTREAHKLSGILHNLAARQHS
jgi:glycosyltransferase involved in cell wall biosynthesis